MVLWNQFCWNYIYSIANIIIEMVCCESQIEKGKQRQEVLVQNSVVTTLWWILFSTTVRPCIRCPTHAEMAPPSSWALLLVNVQWVAFKVQSCCGKQTHIHNWYSVMLWQNRQGRKMDGFSDFCGYVVIFVWEIGMTEHLKKIKSLKMGEQW